MRNTTLLLTTAVAIALGAGACQKTPNAADATANAAAGAPAAVDAAASAPAPGARVATASDFVTAAATSDMYEVAAAKIAQQKSKVAGVKAFAAKMVHDHGATTAELKKILAGGTVNATPPTAMDDRRKAMINDLDHSAPGAFDKAYMDQQVAAHTEAEGVFQAYAGQGDNAALKQFAANTAPKIQAHLDMAKQIDGGLK